MLGHSRGVLGHSRGVLGHSRRRVGAFKERVGSFRKHSGSFKGVSGYSGGMLGHSRIFTIKFFNSIEDNRLTDKKNGVWCSAFGSVLVNDQEANRGQKYLDLQKSLFCHFALMPDVPVCVPQCFQ